MNSFCLFLNQTMDQSFSIGQVSLLSESQHCSQCVSYVNQAIQQVIAMLRSSSPRTCSNIFAVTTSDHCQNSTTFDWLSEVSCNVYFPGGMQTPGYFVKSQWRVAGRNDTCMADFAGTFSDVLSPQFCDGSSMRGISQTAAIVLGAALTIFFSFIIVVSCKIVRRRRAAALQQAGNQNHPLLLGAAPVLISTVPGIEERSGFDPKGQGFA